MVLESSSALLSPPHSPHMSDTAKASDCYNQYAPYALQRQSHLSPQQNGDTGAPQHFQSPTYGPTHSALCSYKDYPYYYARPNQGAAGIPSDSGHAERPEAPPSSHNRLVGATEPQQATSGESAPTTPGDRLTPRSSSSVSKEQRDEEDVIDDEGDELDVEGEKQPVTAAEIRAARRKMKRFRLTHSQTRYLMSEFARQAHPDAAHRERLAREIPGLSARQVQVWFQNRRAKLKRLTSDDRERMMRSRALPADFDTTQALHSPFGAQSSNMGGQISDMSSYPPYPENTSMRPLTIDTLRRVPNYEHYGQQYGSPPGVSAAMGAFTLNPQQPASDHLSPVSAPGGVSTYGTQQPAPYDMTRRPPLGVPGSSQTSYAGPTSMPRGPLHHERLHKHAGEQPTSSPLRTSVSYSALGAAASQNEYCFERASSFSEQSSYPPQRPQLPRNANSGNYSDTSPYAGQFSYSRSPTYQKGEPDRGMSTPRGASEPETEPFRPTNGLSASTYGHFQAPRFGATHMPQYTGYNVQFPSQDYAAAYRHPHQPTAEQQTTTHQQMGHDPRTGYQSVVGAAPSFLSMGSPNAQHVADGQSSY